jgi:hypothetical protein
VEKPGRTLGLSLAIITSVFLFTVIPLAQVSVLLMLQQRFARVEVELGEAGYSYSGGEISGLSEPGMIILTVLGVAFLFIAVLAWRGRPPYMRQVLSGAVIVLTIITVGLTVRALLADDTLSTGLDSGSGLGDVLLQGRLGLSILIPAYVLWYINRGPARAFFRGYYLDRTEGEEGAAA